MKKVRSYVLFNKKTLFPTDTIFVLSYPKAMLGVRPLLSLQNFNIYFELLL
jgi:hypothetical protein